MSVTNIGKEANVRSRRSVAVSDKEEGQSSG